jgi:hypothetical protein
MSSTCSRVTLAPGSATVPSTVTTAPGVKIRLGQQDLYAHLVLAALTKQQGTSWYTNLGGMLALIEEARLKRDAA